MKGVASFDGMPEQGRVEAEMRVDVKVRLFGKLPPMDYHMHVPECDHSAHRFRSVEHGGSIKRWEHVLTVTGTPGGGAVLTDHVTIDAGLSTWLMTLWARYVYSKRHAPRLRMLGLGTGPA